jgi:hypothetical protein
MTAYHPVYPAVWDRTMRELGHAAQLVRCYLLTCPSRASEGLFHMPVGIVAHDLGLTAEQVTKALAELIEGQLVDHDPDAEVVLDRTALRFTPLRNGVDRETGETKVDKRIAGAIRKLRQVPPTRLLHELHRLAVEHSPDLAVAIESEWPHLASQQATPKPLASPFEAPSKPLPSPSQAPSKPHRSPSEGASREELRREELGRDEKSRVREQDEETTCGWCSQEPARMERDGRPFTIDGRPWCGLCEPVEPGDPDDKGDTGCTVDGCGRPATLVDSDGDAMLCDAHEQIAFGTVSQLAGLP